MRLGRPGVPQVACRGAEIERPRRRLSIDVGMTRVHALRTGSVRIKISQMAGRGRGLMRAVNILTDPEWSGWVPIHAWLIEHEEGPILVDTGETARIHERGYLPRWHPFFRRAAQFQVTPDDEIGPQLREKGV